MIDAYVYDYRIDVDQIILQGRTEMDRIVVPIKYSDVGFIGRPREEDRHRIARDMLRIHGRMPLGHMRLPLLEEEETAKIQDIVPIESSSLHPLGMIVEITGLKKYEPVRTIRAFNMVGTIKTFVSRRAMGQLSQYLREINPDVIFLMSDNMFHRSILNIRRRHDSLFVNLDHMLELLDDPLHANEDLFDKIHERILSEGSTSLYKIFDQLVRLAQCKCQRIPDISRATRSNTARHRQSLNQPIFVPDWSAKRMISQLRKTRVAQHNAYYPEATVIKFDRLNVRTMIQVLSCDPQYSLLTRHLERMVEDQSDISNLVLKNAWNFSFYLPEEVRARIHRLIEYKLERVYRTINYPIILLDNLTIIVYIPFNRPVRSWIDRRRGRILDIDSTPLGDNFSLDLRDVASEHIDVRSLSYQYMSREYYEQLRVLNERLQRLEGIKIERKASQAGVVFGDKKVNQSARLSRMSMIDYCTGDVTSYKTDCLKEDTLNTLNHGIIKNNRFVIL